MSNETLVITGASGDVGRALAVPTDVADAEQVAAAGERVEADLGLIDTWINNAMATVLARTWDISDTPASPQPLDNLFTPADQDADRGSHGPFDDQAHTSSIAQTVSRNRGPIALGVASLVAASWAVANREHEESSHVDV
jgi:NAD(P)-dependent dehydrogenase (short-subunit alcohol dehydrogenase family)